MPRRSLQFPTQCHEQDCVLNVGQFRVQIMRQSGSVFGANQQANVKLIYGALFGPTILMAEL